MSNEQWTTAFTVASIERTWGKYQDGMRGLVVEFLADKPSNYCRALFSVMGDLHDGNWPPSRAEMVKAHEQTCGKMTDYAERVPAGRRLAADTEPVVDPAEGQRRVREIIASLGQKVVER